VAVNCSVYLKDEPGKENKHAHFIHSEEATTLLMLLVGSEAVQRIPLHRDMKIVLDKDFLTIQGDDSSARSQDRSKIFFCPCKLVVPNMGDMI
jgi:hypothetical protein